MVIKIQMPHSVVYISNWYLFLSTHLIFHTLEANWEVYVAKFESRIIFLFTVEKKGNLFIAQSVNRRRFHWIWSVTLKLRIYIKLVILNPMEKSK